MLFTNKDKYQEKTLKEWKVNGKHKCGVGKGLSFGVKDLVVLFYFLSYVIKLCNKN